jgi:hypothetical protein
VKKEYLWLGDDEVLNLAMWEDEHLNTYKGYCIKKAYKNMIKKHVDYKYKGIIGFLKLLFGIK